MDLNYEFHQRQSAVSFRVLASYSVSPYPTKTLFSPLRTRARSLFAVLLPTVSPRYFRVSSWSSAFALAFARFPRIAALVPRHPPPHPRATHFAGSARDEKFWRRHKNAALHFPFKITPFAPFSVYYYQVVQAVRVRRGLSPSRSRAADFPSTPGHSGPTVSLPITRQPRTLRASFPSRVSSRNRSRNSIRNFAFRNSPL